MLENLEKSEDDTWRVCVFCLLKVIPFESEICFVATDVG